MGWYLQIAWVLGWLWLAFTFGRIWDRYERCELEKEVAALKAQIKLPPSI